MTHRRIISAALALVALGAVSALTVFAQTAPGRPGGWGSSAKAGPAAGPVIAATQPGMVSPPPTDPRLPQPEARRFLPDDGLHTMRPPAATFGGRPVARMLPPAPPPSLLPPPPPATIVVTGVDGAPTTTAAKPVDNPGAIKLMTHSESPEVPKVAPRASTPLSPPLARSVAGSALGIEVVGPAEAAPGQEIPCTIVVRSHSTTVLAGVRVEVMLPPGVRMLASKPEAEKVERSLKWHLGNVEAGGERRLTVNLQAAEAGEIHLSPTASFAAAFGLRTKVQKPAFSVALEGPETASVNDRLSFKITVSNNGRDTLRKIGLRCDLHSGLLHPQGTVIETDLGEDLPPGHSKTHTLDVQARAVGTHRATLKATCEGGPAAEATTVVTIRDLTLAVKIDGPRQLSVGQEATHAVEVANPGSTASSRIRLVVGLPKGVEFIQAPYGGVYDAAGHSVSWLLAELPGKMRHALSLRSKAKSHGDWTVAAFARSEGIADVRATHALQVEAAPTLQVHPFAHDNTVKPGDETTYEIRVYNPGPVPARNVRLVVALPDNLSAVACEGKTTWRIQGGGRFVYFDPIAELPGERDTIPKIRARAVKAGDGAIKTEVHAAGLATPITQDLAVQVKDASARALPSLIRP